MKKQELITPFSTRQYMFSEDYEIYYYSNIPKDSVSEHCHDYYEFYFFIEGNINISISGRLYDIKPGDFMVIPPGIYHNPVFLDNETPYRRFVLWLSSDYVKKMTEASTDYSYIMQLASTSKEYVFSADAISINAIHSSLFNITTEVKGSRFGKTAMVSLLINELILDINRIVYEMRNSSYRQGKSLSNAISEYIIQHLEEDLSLERLEKEFFVSKYHIEHVFKDEFGISLHKYVQMKRLYAARDAIKTGLPIQETYTMYGYSDYSVFFKAFKKEFGVSPKEYLRTL